MDLRSFVHLAIDGGPRFDFPLAGEQGSTVRVHVELVGFLKRLPRFVELALNRLMEADRWFCGPRTDQLHLSSDRAV
jgi:hypothetical protein